MLINPNDSAYKNMAYIKSTPVLSIMIATMPDRSKQFWDLFTFLEIQHQGKEVEIITDCSMDYNIGTKRNRLLEMASGEYVVFADDDDFVSHDYISKILKATESKPDCIGISGTITTNGENERQWHISKDFGSWYERDQIYYRTPNHISPVRRELALKAGFPEITHGEDYYYSMRLLPLLKSEVIIEGDIYYYDYWSFKPGDYVYFMATQMEVVSFTTKQIKLSGNIESVDSKLALIKFDAATNLLVKEPTMYVTLDELNKI